MDLTKLHLRRVQNCHLVTGIIIRHSVRGYCVDRKRVLCISETGQIKRILDDNLDILFFIKNVHAVNLYAQLN